MRVIRLFYLQVQAASIKWSEHVGEYSVKNILAQHDTQNWLNRKDFFRDIIFTGKSIVILVLFFITWEVNFLIRECCRFTLLRCLTLMRASSDNTCDQLRKAKPFKNQLILYISSWLDWSRRFFESHPKRNNDNKY